MIILQEAADQYQCPEKYKCPEMSRKCSGCRCMWWRWFDFKDNRTDPRTYGYCGAGGRPCTMVAEPVKTGE